MFAVKIPNIYKTLPVNTNDVTDSIVATSENKISETKHRDTSFTGVDVGTRKPPNITTDKTSIPISTTNNSHTPVVNGHTPVVPSPSVIREKSENDIKTISTISKLMLNGRNIYRCRYPVLCTPYKISDTLQSVALIPEAYAKLIKFYLKVENHCNFYFLLKNEEGVIIEELEIPAKTSESINTISLYMVEMDIPVIKYDKSEKIELLSGRMLELFCKKEPVNVVVKNTAVITSVDSEKDSDKETEDSDESEETESREHREKLVDPVENEGEEVEDLEGTNKNRVAPDPQKSSKESYIRFILLETE